MNIRILKEADAVQYQELRLRALEINPEAFGSTYEREVEFTQKMIEERIRRTEERFVLGAFDDENVLVGIVTYKRETSLKTAHKGNIYGMFVAPETRGQGLGKQLIQELVSKAKQSDGLEQINLTVVSNNLPAKKLYSASGFETYGVERNALKYNGEYFDEDLMVLFI
ncbi:MAG: GNAT family N-acetyltransferase [Heyndrickxia sp.]